MPSNTLGLALVMATAALPLVIASAAVMGIGFGCFSSLANRRVIASLVDRVPRDRIFRPSGRSQTGNAVGAATAGAVANMVGFSGGFTIPTGYFQDPDRHLWEVLHTIRHSCRTSAKALSRGGSPPCSDATSNIVNAGAIMCQLAGVKACQVTP